MENFTLLKFKIHSYAVLFVLLFSFDFSFGMDALVWETDMGLGDNAAISNTVTYSKTGIDIDLARREMFDVDGEVEYYLVIIEARAVIKNRKITYRINSNSKGFVDRNLLFHL